MTMKLGYPIPARVQEEHWQSSKTLLRGICGGRKSQILALAILVTGATFLSLAFESTASAQDSGSGAYNSEQPPITPAVNPTVPSSASPQPLFPSAGTLSSPSLRSPLQAPGLPLPGLGAGLGSGPIKPGDIVQVQVFEAPEYSTSMPVSAAGEIAIPYVGIFKIGGMTSKEAANAITSLFIDRQILRSPHVIVTTQQFGNSVTVYGEVRSPGVYPLRGQQRLIDVLGEAGGVTDRAGHVIQIFDGESLKDPHSLVWDPSLRQDEAIGVKLKIGQTVVVSRCGVVFVGGNVNRPGVFPLCDTKQMTLSEVIALAMGIKPSTWGQRTLLLRSSDNGTRVVEKIHLEDVLRGKKPDPIMQADDIVFVQPSALKAAGKVVAQAAMGFAAQAYFYTR